MLGGGESYAQSATKASLFTADNGYTEVKSLPTDPAELAKYYYVIADASEETMLQLADGKSGQNGSGKVMEYVAVNDPLQNQGDLWIIEHTTEGYHIRSVAYSGLLMQTEWNKSNFRHTNDQPHACQWTKVNMAYTEGTGWQIENGTYTGGYFGYWDKTNSLNEIASDKSGDAIGKYTIYQIERAKYFEKYYQNATKDADGGVDVTNLIVNPDVMGGQQYQKNVEGYSITYNGGHNLPYIPINVDGVNVYQFEFYGYTRLDFTMSQTASVPNGKYKLTTTMFTDQGGTANETVGMFANDKFVGITENGSTYKEYSIDGVTVTDETLTLGYKTSGTAATKWFRGTGFKLTYYGEDLSAYTEVLNSAITTAEAITPAANAAANKALTDAITKAKAVDQTNKDEILSGTTELNNAIKTYNAAKTAYDSYADVEAYAKSMQAEMNVAEDADKTTFADAIQTQETAMAETATDAAAIKACEDALIAACKVYVGKANPAADKTFDITRLYLVNPDLTGLQTWKTCDGWYSDIVAGQVMQNAEVKGDTDKDYFFEIYTQNAGGFTKGNGVYQKATLPAGTYKMEAYGFARAANNVAGTGDGYISAFANETLGAPTLANTMTEISTAFTLDAEGEAKMGLYIADGNKGNWAGCGYMKLYKYNSSALAVAKAAYDEAKTAAEALKDSKMNKEVSDALVAAINATPEENAASYQAATSALVSAASNANVSIIAYASLKTALDKYPVHSDFGGVDFTARTEAEAAYNDGTYTNDEATAKATSLLNDYRQYLRDIVKNYKTATAFVIDATRTDGTVTGWTPAANAVNKNLSSTQNSVDFTGNYMENWGRNSLSGNISQTVKNLPNGKYFLKMVAKTNASDANLSKDNIYIKSGEAQSEGAVLRNDNPSITITDPIEVKNGEVEIGLHIGSGANWVIWNAVELYAYSIDDQTRSTSTGKYGTVSLPYNATVDGAKLYEAAVNDAKNEVVLTEANGNVEAGKAYIYLATADTQTFSYADEANMVKDPAAGALIGVFAQQTALAGTYVMQTKDGEQKFFKVAEGQEPTLKAYRAYLNVETTSAAKALTISFGNPTAVDAVKALTEDNAVIYDLTGKRLAKLQRGVNIVNGVKVVVK